MTWRWGCTFFLFMWTIRIPFTPFPVYINLPVCLVALIILALSLRGVEFKISPNSTVPKLLKSFDFIGLYVILHTLRKVIH